MELIDRKELIDRIVKNYCDGCDDYNGLRCRACPTDDAIQDIEDAPTIDAVPVRHGEWIVHTEVKNIYGGICVECPVCGDHFVVLNVSDEKYCRSCGTKMDGGKRE